MEHVKAFLDTSTIHGLSWISSTRRWLRFLWILIVIGGFAGALALIYQSFYSWEQNPISTTVETLPISEIRFPNVTVCPPENSFLNLNYDIVQSENLTIDDKKKSELYDNAIELIQDSFFDEIIANLSKIEDPLRYYNWYHGYTKITYPYNSLRRLHYDIYTSAVEGNFSTQYFGQQFNADKVEQEIFVEISMTPPIKVRYDKNATLLVNLLKETMKEFSANDRISIECSECWIDADIKHYSKNISNIGSHYLLKFDRQIPMTDIKHVMMDKMPGFRFTWNYIKQVQPQKKFHTLPMTKALIR